MPNKGPTSLQQDILFEWEQRMNASAEEIADACNCSTSYVNETLREYTDDFLS